MKVIAKIEADKFEDSNDSSQIIELEYLILYDLKGNQLAKGDNKPIPSIHELEYDGLIYLANEQGRISIDYHSLINKFDNDQQP